MEQEKSDKPFKTIEVIDHDTRQTCKVACMSCIRGHRTTSCGIPVCRSKVFWTVKRPGRPANSCTCRFNSSGVCKCVTAIPKCPHKSAKKGEKRSSECRCDEQGRFCCLLELQHWQTLFASQKPLVQFFPTRDALEVSQSSVIASPTTPSGTSALLSFSTPKTSTCCGGGGSEVNNALATPKTSRTIAPSPRVSISSPPSSQPVVTRFGFMGVGAPMGSDTTPPPDVMAWNTDVPIAYPHSTGTTEPEELGACCGGRGDEWQPPPRFTTSGADYRQGYSAFSSGPSAPGQYTFDFDRWNQDYHIYQFPNAICQNCGLNGCTCRSCPPLMQNFGTTSWAQSCGRRHARIAPAPPQPLPPPPPQQVSSMVHEAQPDPEYEQPTQASFQHGQLQQHFHEQHNYITMPELMTDIHDQHQLSQPHDLPFHTNGHTITNTFTSHGDLVSPDMTSPLGFPEYVVHTLGPPDQRSADENMFGG